MAERTDVTTTVEGGTWPLDDALLDHDAVGRLYALDDLGDAHPAWAGIRSTRVRAGGADARVLRLAGRGDGPTVVLVHGLGGAATNWLPVMPGLASIGDVVAVDLPGFGETAPARPASARPRNNARFLATLLHALEAGPVVLVGNSMGGLVSTLTAASHPGLVRALVLLGAALPPHLLSARPSAVQISSFGPMLVPVIGPRIVRRRLQRLTFAEQYDRMVDGITARPDAITTTTRAVGTANLARVHALRWRGAAFKQATTGLVEALVGRDRGRTLDAMRSIEAPVLYLRGATDPLVLAATTRLVRRTCPHWVVEELDGIGHVPMLEDPVGTADRIVRFVADADVAPLS